MSNKYTYSVPFSEDQLYQDYFVSGMNQSEIAKKYQTTQRVVWRAMKKIGLKSRIAAKRNQTGKLNHSWKGGRVLVAKKREIGQKYSFGNGYYYILAPEHPNANKSGYVAEHIFIITQEIGRALEDDEIVHHINLNKHDNRLENLALTNRKKHGKWHYMLEEIAIEFMKLGLVGFDPENGYYIIEKQE